MAACAGSQRGHLSLWQAAPRCAAARPCALPGRPAWPSCPGLGCLQACCACTCTLHQQHLLMTATLVWNEQERPDVLLGSVVQVWGLPANPILLCQRWCVVLALQWLADRPDRDSNALQRLKEAAGARAARSCPAIKQYGAWPQHTMIKQTCTVWQRWCGDGLLSDLTQAKASLLKPSK